MFSTNEKSFRIRINLTEQAGSVVQTCEEHFGVPWKAQIEFENGNGLGVLACEEEITDSRGGGKKWNVLAEMATYLIVGGQDKLIGPTKTFSFKPWAQSTTICMIARESLSIEGAAVEVRVKINSMSGVLALQLEDFSVERPGWTDVIVKVGEQKFYENRAAMARISNVFRGMLYDEFNMPATSEVLIHDVEPNDFHTFLQLAHSKKPRIKIESVEKILELSEKYGVQRARDGVEQFLIGLEGIEIAEGVQLADRFGLNELLKFFLRNGWKIEHYKPLENVFDTLKTETQAAIVREMFRIEEENKKTKFKIYSEAGQEYTLSYDREDRVERIVRNVARIGGIPPERQRLQQNGRNLRNGALISDYLGDDSDEIRSKVVD